MSDVFISHAAKDKPVGDALCAALEAKGIRCWIAPRDVRPGVPWGEAIIDGINESRILILILSSISNNSPQVVREVERAVSKGIPIIPFRIEDVPLSKGLEYFVAATHWLDALTPPLEKHLQHLVETAGFLLSRLPPRASGTVVEEGGARVAAQTSRPLWTQALERGETLERAEQEQQERQRVEAERLAREKAEAERELREMAGQDRLARERAEAERKAAEHAEAERKAQEKAEQEEREREHAEAERMAGDRAEAERKAPGKAEQEERENAARSRTTFRCTQQPVSPASGSSPALAPSSPSSEARVAQVPVAGRKLWKVLVPAALMLVAAAVGGTLYFRSRQAMTRLTDKDTIVLSDFDNKTGDSVFDDTLKQGLSVQLEQSPFLDLVSERKVNETLKLMGRPVGDRLTPEVTQEVCQRTGSKAMLTGSIAGLGSQYVIGLKAVNCETGDVLAETQEQAASKEAVLKALDAAAVSLRSKLGESLGSVQKYATPVEEATTPSLEALKAYSLGCHQKMERSDDAGAVPLFQRAISLDPNFAMAYARLGTSYYNLGETTRAAENTRKAYELRERVSDREKFYIASHYETFVTGNLEAACKAYELWAQTYPRDAIPPITLVSIYYVLGDYDKALARAQEAMKLDPGSGINYGNLGSSYVQVNRLDEARATAQEAQAHNLDNPQIHLVLYEIDFLQHDAAGMEREAAGLMGKPGYDDVMLYAESETAAYGGQFAKARELTRRASDSAQRADNKEMAASYEAAAAVDEVLVGNMSQAKQQAQAALALSTSGDLGPAWSALALGLAGDAPQATRLAADLAKRFPEDTIVQFDFLPMIHAAAALQSGSATKALEALAPAAPYELGTTAGLYPVYLRGEGYLTAHQGSFAAAEFQKILDHACVVLYDLVGALAHLGLARAYALSGDTVKAKSAYQDFLGLWKDADPDIPILKEAKAEYAKLK
jgi:Flp pilus assembly protein TadD